MAKGLSRSCNSIGWAVLIGLEEGNDEVRSNAGKAPWRAVDMSSCERSEFMF